MSRQKINGSKADSGLSNAYLSDPNSSLVPNMPPTPAKTPRKRVLKPEVKSTARVLFPERPETVEQAMPASRKRSRGGKKHIGFSLDDDASSEGKIEIFTDTKDKIPELDETEDNPFYEKPGSRPKRGGKKKTKGQVMDHNKEVQEALERDEGMIYVL